MSTSEKTSQCDDNGNKPTWPNIKEEHDSQPVIPKDHFGYFAVHVSNLPMGIAQKLLEATFSDAGRVQVCKIVEHPNQPVYAFVKFLLMEEAQEALKFDGYKLNDNVLSVRPAYGRFKRGSSSGPRRDSRITFSDKGRFMNGGNKQEGNHRITYYMASTDCRVKDGKLSDADVVTFNGSTGKMSPPKKGNERRVLAPRFKKDSPPPRFQSSNHCKSPTSQISQEPETYHGVPATYQTAGPSTSAFIPYQRNFQEPNLQNDSRVENCVMTVTSSFSQLEVSSPDVKNATSVQQSHENRSLNYQQGDLQGVAAWSHTAAMGITTNTKDHSVANQSRSANIPVHRHNSPVKPGISSWSTSDVVQYFLSTDCAEYAGFFQDQEIDGKALLLLNRETLFHFLKVGPALKVLQLIEKLISYGPPNISASNGQ